jgi:hypothetical protein
MANKVPACPANIKVQGLYDLINGGFQAVFDNIQKIFDRETWHR